MNFELDYEADIHIDELALDLELLRQPNLMLRYCRNAAHSRKQLDLSKEALDMVKSQLAKSIRRDPKKFGYEKLTEGGLLECIQQSAEHRKAMREYIDFKYEYEVAIGVVRSIDQKKSALENLVRLHGASYFAGPAVPRDLSRERAEFKKESAKSANRVVSKRTSRKQASPKKKKKKV